MTEYQQPVHLFLLAWSCLDECKYNCMWETVDSFHQRNWKTPQFHGKVSIVDLKSSGGKQATLLRDFL